jgi:hypothetical protein
VIGHARERKRRERTVIRHVDERVKLECGHFRCFGEYEIKVEEKDNKWKREGVKKGRLSGLGGGNRTRGRRCMLLFC